MTFDLLFWPTSLSQTSLETNNLVFRADIWHPLRFPSYCTHTSLVVVCASWGYDLFLHTFLSQNSLKTSWVTVLLTERISWGFIFHFKFTSPRVCRPRCAFCMVLWSGRGGGLWRPLVYTWHWRMADHICLHKFLRELLQQPWDIDLY